MLEIGDSRPGMWCLGARWRVERSYEALNMIGVTTLRTGKVGRIKNRRMCTKQGQDKYLKIEDLSDDIEIGPEMGHGERNPRPTGRLTENSFRNDGPPRGGGGNR